MADKSKIGAVVYVPSGTDDATPFLPAIVVKAYGDYVDAEVLGGEYRNVVKSAVVFATVDAVVVPDQGTYVVSKV